MSLILQKCSIIFIYHAAQVCYKYAQLLYILQNVDHFIIVLRFKSFVWLIYCNNELHCILSVIFTCIYMYKKQHDKINIMSLDPTRNSDQPKL